LASPSTKTLGKDDLKTEKSRAFDLLDALTKSGAQALQNTVLHVVIASTQTFDKSLLHTVCRDNINPIERAEATAVVIASTLHGRAPPQLVRASQLERLVTFSSKLQLIEAPPAADDDDDNDKK
jgi:hypothetical protein